MRVSRPRPHISHLTSSPGQRDRDEPWLAAHLSREGSGGSDGGGVEAWSSPRRGPRRGGSRRRRRPADDGDVEQLASALRQLRQHVIRAALLRRRLADADAHAQEVLGVQVLGDAAQPVVAGQTTAGLHPHDAGGRSSSSWTTISCAGSSSVVATHQRLHRSPAVVHERQRKGQHDLMVGDRALGDQRLVATGLESWRRAVPPGGRPTPRRRCGACGRTPCPGFPSPTTSMSISHGRVSQIVSGGEVAHSDESAAPSAPSAGGFAAFGVALFGCGLGCFDPRQPSGRAP